MISAFVGIKNQGTVSFNPSYSTTQNLMGGYYEGGSMSTAAAWSTAYKKMYTIGNVSGNGSLSATGVTNYKSLSANDFYLRINSVTFSTTGNGHVPSGRSGTISPKLSYNASTGVISISGCTGNLRDDTAYVNVQVNCAIYCIA